MIMNTAKAGPYLLYIIALLILAVSVSNLNCKFIENPPGIVAAVQNVNLKISSDSTGTKSAAEISWSASQDENRSDFGGYRVITYRLDTLGNIDSKFESAEVSKSIHSFVVDSIKTGITYQTFISSRLNDGSLSDSTGTLVYAGVFYRTDGTIDQFEPGDQTLIVSGFGWDVQTGEGFNLPYMAENTDFIDLHLEQNLSGILVFYSPSLFTPGTRFTLFSLVGSGEGAFDSTTLAEPSLTSIDVDINNVYLLKTQDGYYIKVWVKDLKQIPDVVSPYYRALFDYKVQSVAGLRVL